MVSIYQLKPQFQALLRPAAKQLATAGISANAVTIFAMTASCVLGAWLCIAKNAHWFLLLPAWMFLRMALNALDGMLAREFNQQTPLGAYLNELSDVISDAALVLPFAWIHPFNLLSISGIIFLLCLSEMAGALAPVVGAQRRYDGPMGKSDRAVLFGALGLWIGTANTLPAWTFWLLPATAVLIAWNTINRIRGGLQSIPNKPQQ